MWRPCDSQVQAQLREHSLHGLSQTEVLPLFLTKAEKDHDLNQDMKVRLIILLESLTIVNSNGSCPLFRVHYVLSA